MVIINQASLEDRQDVMRLIAEYHASEHLTPNSGRIGSTLDLMLTGQFPGVVLLARDNDVVVGVALATYLPSAELGRVMNLHDFYVVPAHRRTGVGTILATQVLEEAKRARVDEINLEVVSGNETAALFWKSMGLEPAGRMLFRRRIEYSPV